MKSIRKKIKRLEKPISSSSKLLQVAEKRHIQAHLALTELRLRVFHNNNIESKTQRSAILNMLHEYWINGVFPKNTYQTNKRTPVFIDESGTYCAVGYLMAKSGYSNLAKYIDQTEKFAIMENLENADVRKWLTNHSLSRKEAALIQPGYGGFIIERVSYTVQDKILACISIVASLLLISLMVIGIRLLRNRTVPSDKKRQKLFKLVAGVALTVASFVFIPFPHRVLVSLTPGAVPGERITCSSWNTSDGNMPAICNEFKQKDNVPGWRKVPCNRCLL